MYHKIIKRIIIISLELDLSGSHHYKMSDFIEKLELNI